jgi:inward rectifier potassium channel
MASNAEILVNVSGVDETFSQTIYSRFSYLPNEIQWNYRFVDILKLTPEAFFVDMDNIHSVVPLEGPSA